MTDNLFRAVDMMFAFSGNSAPERKELEKLVKKKNWYQKYKWTFKEENKYLSWFEGMLKKNWEGITAYKPTSKAQRQKAADEFNLCYGFVNRRPDIKDFIPVVPWDQIKDVLSEKELKDFEKWMFGQTSSMHGVYKWDLEQWLTGGQSFD